MGGQGEWSLEQPSRGGQRALEPPASWTLEPGRDNRARIVLTCGSEIQHPPRRTNRLPELPFALSCPGLILWLHSLN